MDRNDGEAKLWNGERECSSQTNSCGDILLFSRPDLRLIFFRFARIYELGIRPVFVFDGPCRHPLKRDKLVDTRIHDTEFRRALLQLIDMFKFQAWMGNGEAEAECAALERLGVVDAILTGDVDVFLFGGRRVIRGWPRKKHDKVPCYDSLWIQQNIGLTRADLILIALLRGGDYDTKGTAGVGIAVAEALARCQHHRKLFEMISNDQEIDKRTLDDFRDNINYEISSGCQGRIRRNCLVQVSDEFPDMQILREYIRPKSNIAKKEYLSDCRELTRFLDCGKDRDVDLENLALFCREAFQWNDDTILQKFRNLLFSGFARNRLCRKTAEPDTSSISQLRQRRRSKGKDSSAQTTVNNFFSVTKSSTTPHRETANIYRILQSKTFGSSIKFYLVEYDQSLLDTFIDTIKQALKQTTPIFSSIFEHCLKKPAGEEQVAYEEEEDDDGDTKDTGLDRVRRRWVAAKIVEASYPMVAKTYEEAKRSRLTKKHKKNTVGKTRQMSMLDFFQTQSSQ